MTPQLRRGLVLVAVIVLLASACGSDDSDAASTTSTSTTSTTSTTTAAPAADSTTTSSTTTTTTTAGVIEPAPQSGDTGALLLAFAGAWDTADWDAMSKIASAEAVAVATEWYEEGGFVNLTADNLDLTLETCFEPTAGETRCEFVYAPPEGFGLIFDAGIAAGTDGLIVTELVFGGDAG